MARGKQTCKILKEIRRQIAKANDIEFITSECSYKGDCLGTCPKCEAEVRFLEQQLRARSIAGKAVVLAGISASTMLVSGCNSCSSHNHPDEVLQGEPVELISDSIGNDGYYAGEIIDSLVRTPSITSNIDPDIPIVGEVTDATNEVPFVDTPATFPGGEQKLMEWIFANLQITPLMAESDVTGRVIITFIVKADGSIGDVEVLKSLHPHYDQEAVRVVKSLPKFTPATTNGKAVDFKYTLPILFRLR